jgi:hypothetical protein
MDLTGQNLLEVVLGAVGYGLLVHLRAWVKLNPDSMLTKVLDGVAANYGAAANQAPKVVEPPAAAKTK